METKYQLLPIETLQPGHYQPRQTFDNDSLEELARSIIAQGLIEPLVVREIAPQRYEIIAGERRWRASCLAGLTELPCLIGNYTDAQTAAVSLIENIQRQDLNLLEEANGYRRLHDEFNFNQEEIAALVSKSRSHVANLMRLLTLCPAVQDKIRSQTLTLGHARSLVGLTVEQQQTFSNLVSEQGWSVRQLEDYVRKTKLKGSIPFSPPDRNVVYLQDKLAELLGAPVHILKDSEQGGWLKIKFFDNDTLAGLLERIGLRYD